MARPISETFSYRGGQVLLALLLALTYLIGPAAAPAAAAYTHQYSIALENSHGTHYTGVLEYRYDTRPASIPEQILYQSMWVGMQGSAWVELGTAHWPSASLDAWYWGYGATDGSWHQVGYQRIANGSRHSFEIARPSTYYWNAYVDGSQKMNLGTGTSWTTSGLSAGLETYSTAIVMGPTQITTLEMQLDYGSWLYWDGKDGKSVSPANMCGNWISSTAFNAGENVASC